MASLDDVLSALQNGVKAINGLYSNLTSVVNTTISSSGNKTYTIRLTHVSS
jgi:hypothetical protein